MLIYFHFPRFTPIFPVCFPVPLYPESLTGCMRKMQPRRDEVTHFDRRFSNLT